MALGNKQIGWSQESNLLWQLGKLLERLIKVTAAFSPSSSLAFKLISTSGVNPTLVKDSAGIITNIVAISLAEEVKYLKLYNVPTNPEVGTDTPIMTIPIPTNTLGAGFVIPISNGVNFSQGISFAITGGIADSDTTAILADEVVVNLTYI